MSSRPRTLPGILSPLSVSDFVRNVLGKQFHHIRGEQGRFSSLLPWNDLNDILRHHRLDHPRLRLVREGKAVPVEKYTSRRSLKRHPNASFTRLRPDPMTAELREGATLVIDSVDELQEPIAKLAED